MSCCQEKMLYSLRQAYIFVFVVVSWPRPRVPILRREAPVFYTRSCSYVSLQSLDATCRVDLYLSTYNRPTAPSWPFKHNRTLSDCFLLIRWLTTVAPKTNVMWPSTVWVINFPNRVVVTKKHQAMYRAFMAKREVAAIRANRDEFERRRLEEARATVLIQSGVRGRAARRTAAAKRAAIVDAARRERGLLIIQVRSRRETPSWYCCCCCCCSEEGIYSARRHTSRSVKGVSRYGNVHAGYPTMSTLRFGSATAAGGGAEVGPTLEGKSRTQEPVSTDST